MTKVQICWTRGVSKAEVSTVQSGVSDVLKYVTRDFSVDLMGPTCAAEVWAENCLRQKDAGFGPQVDADCVLNRQIPPSLVNYARSIGQEPSDVSCLSVVCVDFDITVGEENFLFGGSQAGIGSVLSVARLRGSTIADKVLRRLARHEFGHALGLIPDARSTNVRGKIGLHCTNVCTMRQGMNLQKFEALTIEEERADILFCRECADYLRNGLADFKVIFGG